MRKEGKTKRGWRRTFAAERTSAALFRLRLKAMDVRVPVGGEEGVRSATQDVSQRCVVDCKGEYRKWLSVENTQRRSCHASWDRSDLGTMASEHVGPDRGGAAALFGRCRRTSSVGLTRRVLNFDIQSPTMGRSAPSKWHEIPSMTAEIGEQDSREDETTSYQFVSHPMRPQPSQLREGISR